MPMPMAHINSKNEQQAARELMTPDEVRMLDNKYALLFIRAERPIKDLKFDILQHPAVNLTTDGDAPPYIHGEPYDAMQTIELISGVDLPNEIETDEAIETNYILLSEEDIAYELSGIGTGARVLSPDADAELIQDILHDATETEDNDNEEETHEEEFEIYI